ncbi:MAG: hypothetical protein KKE62_13980 [Proteobacteria bacterium]|nr:hypothetical protein [Pseudomonadota bacterium]MBU1386314.1 hypothetical protein [Pseudomonadota bacterium]MBU1543938.1 hypothetical protein [Pseudomonadota bacterium]MBU2430153.1 hypothetical protein [Pseudomonadota bacterium]MBU2482265.1 hypothetical protein [Pseudomonadota bacterium]
MKILNNAGHKIFLVILFFMTLSGFSQMPIFKRYYIADIPGLGWLAQFYVTHMIHYIFAGLLIGFAAYMVLDSVFNKTGFKKISRTGYIKIWIIAGLMITGLVLVVKNLSGIYMGHSMIIFLDISHLFLCVLFLMVSLYSLIFKKPWQAD